MAISKRFFHPAQNFTAQQLLSMLKDADLLCHDKTQLKEECIIIDIAGTDDDEPTENTAGYYLSYAESAKYMQAAAKIKNLGLLLVPEKLYDTTLHQNIVAVKGAEYAFAILAREFYPQASPITVSNTAVHSQNNKDSQIGEGVVIGKDVIMGKNVRIGSHSVIGDGCVIGDNCDIGNHCSIRATQMGESCRILSGAVIGERGFGFASFEDRPPLALPHIGGVVMGNHVEVASNCAIDRGKFTDTCIGNYVKLDNMVHIAHNVDIGDGTLIAAQVGVAGSVRIGRQVMIGGQTAVAPSVTIGDKAIAMPCSGVHTDVPEGVRVSGSPIQKATDFARSWAALKQLANKRSKP